MAKGAARTSTARLVLPICVALAIAATGAPAAPAAPATTIALTDAAGVRTIDAAGHAGATITTTIVPLSLAYDGSGRLLAAVDPTGGQVCDVVDPATGEAVAAGATVIASTERGAGVCALATDPAGGVLFETSNLTAGSLATYRLAADGGVTWATSGYAASGALDGTVVAVVHRYWSAGGSYEQPWLTTPSGATRALAPAPSRAASSSWRAYTSVAITRDAARVAATAIVGTHSSRGELRVGPASGRLSSVRWRLARGRTFAGVQWLPDGSGLVVGVWRSSRARTFDLYRCDSDGGHRTRLATGVRAYAVGID